MTNKNQQCKTKHQQREKIIKTEHYQNRNNGRTSSKSAKFPIEVKKILTPAARPLYIFVSIVAWKWCASDFLLQFISIWWEWRKKKDCHCFVSIAARIFNIQETHHNSVVCWLAVFLYWLRLEIILIVWFIGNKYSTTSTAHTSNHLIVWYSVYFSQYTLSFFPSHSFSLAHCCIHVQ